MGREDRFGDKANTAGFNKNPQNINRTGENRRSITQINGALKKRGVKPFTKKQYHTFLSLILAENEEGLKELAEDKQVPLALRIAILELKDKRTRGKALTEYRDYLFGKPEQKLDANMNVNIKARVLTPEEAKELFSNLEKDY